MQYTSEEARLRARYHTFREWVGLIRRASNCSAKRAQRQIVEGLSDGKFAVRWEDQGKSAVRDPYDPDLPPPSGAFWRNAQIDRRSGKVFDDWGVTGEGRATGLAYWRTLLLAPKGGTVFEQILRSPSAFKDDRSAEPDEADATLTTPEVVNSMPPGRGGRKKGSGSINDEPRLREMLRLLAENKAVSVHAAAKKVARTKKANQSIASEVSRLRRKFAERWGTELPTGRTWADAEHNRTAIESNPNYPIERQYKYQRGAALIH
jgi:hypothetical protein